MSVVKDTEQRATMQLGVIVINTLRDIIAPYKSKKAATRPFHSERIREWG